MFMKLNANDNEIIVWILQFRDLCNYRGKYNDFPILEWCFAQSPPSHSAPQFVSNVTLWSNCMCLIYFKKFHEAWTCCFSAVTTRNRPETKLNQKSLFGLKTTRTTPKHCLQAPVGRSPALSSSLPSSKSCWQTSMSRATHVVKQLHMQSSGCHCHFA